MRDAVFAPQSTAKFKIFNFRNLSSTRSLQRCVRVIGWRAAVSSSCDDDSGGVKVCVYAVMSARVKDINIKRIHKQEIRKKKKSSNLGGLMINS